MRLRDLGVPVIKVKVGAGRISLSSNPAAFKKGNRQAAKALMNEDSNKRRLAGLFKAWSTSHCSQGGVEPVSVRKKTRKRARLRATVAKEARDIQNLARQHAQEAMIRLAEIVNDRNSQDSVAIAAAAVMFDRAYGKASQTNINANVDVDAKTSEVPAKQLDDRVEQALKRIEAITGGAPKAPPRKKRPSDIRVIDPDTDSSTQH